MSSKIGWRSIEVGKQYQFEEPHELVFNVTVLEDRSGKDEQRKRSGDWVGFYLRIDEILYDTNGWKVGEGFEVGYDMELCYDSGMCFKPVGSMTDYFIPNSL